MSARWVETEELAAGWFRRHGWPWCQRAGRGKPGADLTGMPGIIAEVKSGKVMRSEWLRQHDGPGLRLVLWRPQRFGAGSVGEWPVLMRLEDVTRLLRAAGYGSEEVER